MNSSKKLLLLAVLLLIIGLSLFAYSKRGQFLSLNLEAKSLYEQAQSLEHLHSGIGETRQGDWLADHHESGQTFGEYVNTRYIRLTEERKTLYVLPLGEFDERQSRIVELSAEFLGLYFSCEVKTLATQGLEMIPQKARRVHPSWGVRQINSQFVLDELLPPQLPEDAVALIAFTSSDLYPEEGWNFVFGQASLRQRVGVWSIFRNGDPEFEFKKVLTRTLKTATHETGHMFSIEHCILYNCNMCGSNNMDESDRRPLYLCPECVAKVWLATDCDSVERFRKLRDFCKANGLEAEAEFYAKSLAELE